MLLDLLKLILTIPFLLILPGFFFLLAIFGWRSLPVRQAGASGGGKISFFEKAALVVPVSLILVDLISLLLNRLGILLTGPVFIEATAVFCLACFAVYHYRFGKEKREKETEDPENLFQFSSWQTIFILLSLALGVFIRTAYLSDTIVPSSTDLGHHMYWVQTIVDAGRLPDYGMPDFIVGEHIIFAAANLVSGVGVMTAMPALILFLFNIAGIFTLAILAARLFRNKNITIFAIFVLGVLYAIAAPQGKYVSGGVVGNIFGNALIPVALYFLYRAFAERDGIFAGLFIFTSVGLLYTHHLSSLVLIFSVAAILFLHLILNFKKFFKIIAEWAKIFLKPFPVSILITGLCLLIIVFTPSYFNSAAIGQATGAPSKITRVGLTLDQIELSAGSARLVLGGLGFLLLLSSLKREKYKYSFAAGWMIVLFLATWRPGWLLIDIPSSRVGNYLFLPLSLLAAFGIVRYFEIFRRASTNFFAAALLYTLMFFVITNGLSDSAEVFKARPQFQEAVQTFHSAGYLASTIDASKDIILKDHVNIYADSWYKLFFMKDYKYPLSRGMLTRYADPTKPRETCTRDMISEPQSEAAKVCFAGTGVNYVALNAQIEGDSFEQYPEFSKVYGSDYISIFRRE